MQAHETDQLNSLAQSAMEEAQSKCVACGKPETNSMCKECDTTCNDCEAPCEGGLCSNC